MAFERISSITSQLRALDNIRSARTTFEQLQGKLVSGKEIEKPSDGPIEIRQILNFDTQLDKDAQFQVNNTFASGRLEVTSATLNSIEDMLIELKTIATTLDSSVATSAERTGAVSTVEAFLQEMIQLANTKYLGKFIFGGTNTLSGTTANSAPFNATLDSNGFVTAVTRNPDGIDDLILQEMRDGLNIAVNISGSAPFMPNGEGGAGDVFTTMINLRNALSTNDATTIGNSIATLDSALEQVSQQDSIVGSRLNQLENITEQLDTQKIATREQKSAIEDVDFSELLLEFNTAQTVLTATLQTSSSLLQLSLLNFL